MTGFESRCTGDCHDGLTADFDHYVDSAGVKPGEEGPAFAAWLNAISGDVWDGKAGPVVT